MKKGIVLLTIVLIVVLNIMRCNTYYAEEKSYISNGQTSFYGEYIYDSSDEHQSTSEDTVNNKNDISKKQPVKDEVLPKTGDYINPSYQMIGTSMVVVTLLWVLNKKGKERIR